MVSSVLESLVTIMGVATVMHMSLVYCELRRKLDRVAALQRTLVLLAVDIFWVCATTAAGFAAELASHVYPIRSFGVIMTLGSMLVLLAIAVILPGGVLLGRHTADPDVSAVDKHLGRWLGVLGDWIEKLSLEVAGGLPGRDDVYRWCGMFRLRVETIFIRNFRKSSPIVQAIEFIEAAPGRRGRLGSQLSGAARSLDGRVSGHEEFLGTVAQHLPDSCREPRTGGPGHPDLTKVTAITDGIDLVPAAVLFVNIRSSNVCDVSVCSISNPNSFRQSLQPGGRAACGSCCVPASNKRPKSRNA